MIGQSLGRDSEAGIIHRDLKPSNLVVPDAGQVKVLDFDVAKLLDPPESGAPTKTAALTEDGAAIGTPVYIVAGTLSATRDGCTIYFARVDMRINELILVDDFR
jgi:serine/threonine protein kinase